MSGERDYLQLAAAYQAGVLDGSISACEWVRLACERNRRDLDRQHTEGFPYRFQPDAVFRICRMAEMLPHIKGPKAFIIGKDDQHLPIWNPIVLEPWQCWLLAAVFGWVKADGTRRFRICLALVPRKNAKSTLAAIVLLHMLVNDWESGAECYSAATTRDQAKVIGEIAWEMVRRSPLFREEFGVKMGSKTSLSLSVPATGSKFMPLSADAHSLDGLNISFAAVDEVHAHKTRAVWDVINTATGTRAQPLLFPISTAGVLLGSICHELLQYLQKILSGALEDETFFGVYYTIDEGDDWRLPAIHRKANPNYGVSVKPDELLSTAKAAEQSPGAINNYLTKHCNVFVGSEAAWMTADLWQTCAVEGLTLESLKTSPCWIGVDLAEVRDIAAIVAVFKLDAERYALMGRYYLPAAAVAKSPIAQLSGWVHAGQILQTDGDQADYQRIQADLLSLVEQLKVQEIDFDRALAAQMQQQLKGVLEPRMGKDAVDRFVVTVPQNIQTMNAAMQMTERLVLAKTIQHDGNPAMAWMISNIVVERNYKDEIYPRKAGGKDSPNKIDGPMALFNALSQAMAQPTEPTYQISFVGGRR